MVTVARFTFIAPRMLTGVVSGDFWSDDWCALQDSVMVSILLCPLVYLAWQRDDVFRWLAGAVK